MFFRQFFMCHLLLSFFRVPHYIMWLREVWEKSNPLILIYTHQVSENCPIELPTLISLFHLSILNLAQRGISQVRIPMCVASRSLGGCRGGMGGDIPLSWSFTGFALMNSDFYIRQGGCAVCRSPPLVYIPIKNPEIYLRKPRAASKGGLSFQLKYPDFIPSLLHLFRTPFTLGSSAPGNMDIYIGYHQPVDKGSCECLEEIFAVDVHALSYLPVE